MNNQELDALIHKLEHAKQTGIDWVTLKATLYIVSAKDLSAVIALLKEIRAERKEIC